MPETVRVQGGPSAGELEVEEPRAPATPEVEAPPPQPEPEPERVATVPRRAGDAIAQSAEEARVWLRSIGVDPDRKASTPAADAPRRQFVQSTREESDADPAVERLRQSLNSGDDRAFLRDMLQETERRAFQRVQSEQTRSGFVQRVSAIVVDEAPDIPLPLFWAYGMAAEQRHPGDVMAQIDWAIEQARGAMDSHRDSLADRRVRNGRQREEAETLDAGTPGKRRRVGNPTSDEPDVSFVEQIRRQKDQYI